MYSRVWLDVRQIKICTDLEEQMLIQSINHEELSTTKERTYLSHWHTILGDIKMFP